MRSDVAVHGARKKAVCGQTGVHEVHMRSDVAVHGARKKAVCGQTGVHGEHAVWPGMFVYVAAGHDVHTRLDVAVGATVSAWPGAHIVRLVHTRVAMLLYIVDGQVAMQVWADCRRNKPLTHSRHADGV
jgi:hypothetical protein